MVNFLSKPSSKSAPSEFLAEELHSPRFFPIDMMKLLIDKGNAPAKTGIGIFSDLLMGSLQKYCSDEISVADSAISIPTRRLRSVSRVLYLLRLTALRRRKYDGARIIHFTNQYVPKQAAGVSYIVSIHDLDPLKLPKAHSAYYSLYFRSIIRNSIKRSNLIITQTEFVRSELIDTFGLDEDVVAVGGDGLSDEFMRVVDKQTFSPQRIPILLYVGQLSKKKNIAWLIRIVDEGRKKGALPPMKLVLAGGKGFGFGEIEHAVRTAHDGVEIVLSPSLEKIAELYCSCTAVVLPSLREGFGRPILEAMYCEKPVVLSQIPTSVELAGGGGHYFALENSDQFFQSLKDAFNHTTRDEWKSQSREKLSRYSWKNLARTYLDLYKRVSA